jgi:ABC-type nitrate/sulfonate/bicarbonate transport system substrate-binding protein
VTQIRLALDWYPNIVHSGIILAEQLGFFDALGVDVELVTPEIDGYMRKPIQRLLDGEVDCAIVPSEHLIVFGGWGSANTSVEALATIMQPDCSAFVTTNVKAVQRPRDLDGCTYAAYNTPGELALLKAMIRADGGRGEIQVVTPPRFEVWQALLDGTADLAWVFRPWEGVLAEESGIALRSFVLGDWGVPYGPTSVLTSRVNIPAKARVAVGHMLSAVACGYSLVAHRTTESVQWLTNEPVHSALASRSRVQRAAKIVAPCLLDAHGQWGSVDVDLLIRYRAWLVEHGLDKGGA